MTNPYESPTVSPDPPRQTEPTQMKLLALALLGMGLIPAAATLFEFATRGRPQDFAANDPGVWLGAASSVLPLGGFGLLGLAAWRRSERLTVTGMAVVVVYLAMIAGAFVLSYWR